MGRKAYKAQYLYPSMELAEHLNSGKFKHKLSDTVKKCIEDW
ncbi:hypothetical protein SBF1_6430008 [Candidatus Desulfosporosinus infrequens]|uniref:Uncharacterized protein n=1 Tax=Candidatus Desulfosporosinus infrequens TaxID=2043169 RepID=A0A2U3LMU5_9FIRM|nr:hypothetical protein SBF1_6430008 [Candidatus Desulfosporosinus infrequens]